MYNIQPIRGLRYNVAKIDNLSTVITPPYDIISPEDRVTYHQKSPHNIIRLEYGEDMPGDSTDNNKYTRAAATLDDWLKSGILIREELPAFYIVEEQFTHSGSIISRYALIAGVRLEDHKSGRIRPHELITKEPAVDRMNLLRACRANISPIMGLVHSDNAELANIVRKYSSNTPVMSTEDIYGVKQRLWVITDEQAISEIRGFLRDKAIYIADGHHRYHTALAYKYEQEASHTAHSGNEAYNFVMMCLMDSCDPGLVMLPTHRLVRGLDPLQSGQILETISPYFEIVEMMTPLSTTAESADDWLRNMGIKGRDNVVLGLYGLFDGKLCLIRLRHGIDIAGEMTGDELRLWRNSDVFLLQRLILKNTLGIDSLEQIERHLAFTRNAAEAVSRVDSGEFQIAFLLNPAPVLSVIDAADAGMRLPQKSTYFHPKTPAGLVINPLWYD